MGVSTRTGLVGKEVVDIVVRNLSEGRTLALDGGLRLFANFFNQLTILFWLFAFISLCAAMLAQSATSPSLAHAQLLRRLANPRATIGRA